MRFWLLVLIGCHTPHAIDADAAADTTLAVDAPSGGAKIHVVLGTIPSSLPHLDMILSSPLVDGVSAALDWSLVDRGPGAAGGQYQWHDFEQAIAPFIAAGKRVNVLVQTMDYNTPPGGIPAYVTSDPMLPTVSCTNHPNVPIVYDPSFKTPYKAFVAEVLRHFANDPRIGYIRIGIGTGNEAAPMCASVEAGSLPLAQWKTDVWLPYDLEMLDFEAQQNPTMPIEGPMTGFGTDNSWSNGETANAVAHGFGFGNQGMQKSDVANDPACHADWCNLFDANFGTITPLQLSTLKASDPSGTSTASGYAETGPLPPLLALAMRHHATDFELYPQDLLLALDSTYCNPIHQCSSEYGAAYLDALTAVHR
jgi:hypothetical protein